MEKIKRLFATAASKNGSYSVGLTAMAVAAVLLFNLAAGQLPQQAKQTTSVITGCMRSRR